jgi:hypothetical protein
MKLRTLFKSDVTRDIAPVIYFHEQSPETLAREIGEYIITGGFDDTHPHRKRVADGIHEQYVRLLNAITAEVEKGRSDLPASSWISGFYGSGKSSFAKLLGLALDGVVLPDKRSLAQALLDRDTSPRAAELTAAYKALRAKVPEPLGVVFDVGGAAQNNEHVHVVAVQRLQRRLGYCPEPSVAEMELKLERDGKYAAFEKLAAEVLGKPWSVAKDEAMADDSFSLVLSRQFPDLYIEPMSWLNSRAGTYTGAMSAEDASRAIGDMVRFRSPQSTVFFVIDEVSQYVHQDTKRMLALQSFVTALAQHRGKVWLLVTGQEKLEEGGDLAKMKDRFPEKLRVHLGATNIRDVVHQRLLAKTPAAADDLRARFATHRNDLRLYAYDCDAITDDDFVETYPLLPGHVDLILQITSAIRLRSTRSQGDDQTLRGLLGLLSNLFARHGLADAETGVLVTLDRMYDVQYTALTSEVQASMVRILQHCEAHGLKLAAKAAKAVALLELIQERVPTDAKLVAACLYQRIDQGSQQAAVTDALEELRRIHLLGYSEKQGYKIQSTSGEEWERERREMNVAPEVRGELIQDALKHLVADQDAPKLEGRPFPWLALFSDGRRTSDQRLVDPRDAAAITVDFRWLTNAGDRDKATWIARSNESTVLNRLLWVVGETAELDEAARELGKSIALVRKYEGRSQSLPGEKQRLWLEEKARTEHELTPRLRRAVEAAWVDGRMYFRGKATDAREVGNSIGATLSREADRVLRALFPHFVATRVSNAEVIQLIEENGLNAPSPKFLGELGILELENGRYTPTCKGVVPKLILDHITSNGGESGAGLYAHFGGPPYGFAPEVVRACIAGLLRGSKIRIQTESGDQISAARDAGTRDVLEKERAFKAATIYPVSEDAIGTKGRARICKFFEQRLDVPLDRENDAIADAVAKHFPGQIGKLREVFDKLRRLRPAAPLPERLTRLEDALASCFRLVRQTEPTVAEVQRQLDALTSGIEQLGIYASELTQASVDAVKKLDDIAHYQLAQLVAFHVLPAALEAARDRVEQQVASETPWRGVAALDRDLASISDAYVDARRTLLGQQETAIEAARARIRLRDGFAMLDRDKVAHVMRAFQNVLAPTAENAIAPALDQLRDAFERALPLAERDANDRLDAVLSEGNQPLRRKVMHNLSGREISSVDELENALDEVRQLVSAELAQGHKVRLV